MNVVFLGPPGSGKGTQAARLSSEFGWIHLSTGDVFREAIKNQTALGQKIQSFVNSGKLVPDSLVSEVVFEKLKGLGSPKGVLLDGYPRTVDQAKDLDRFSDHENFKLDAILFFEVNAPALVKRLSARRQCLSCKAVYNLDSNPPKKESLCDACGTSLVQRPDDKAEVVLERLQVYDKETAPVRSHYSSKKEYKVLDASQDIEKVYGDMVALVRK